MQAQADSEVDDLFMPLAEAASLAYEAATGDVPWHEAMLNNVAREIAARSRVFSRSLADGTYSIVFPLELREGELQGGGRSLRFNDARLPLYHLAIFRSDFPKLLQDVQLIYGSRADRKARA